jgi:predicted nucleic acid-binding protein
MNVLDSSGWLEYLSDGPHANTFQQAASDSENLVIPTICIYEVFKKVLSQLGEERALEAAAILSRGEIADLDRQIAIEAAQLSIEHKLSMADSIILATAQAHQATLWTQDAHFKEIPGVRYIEKRS